MSSTRRAGRFEVRPGFDAFNDDIGCKAAGKAYEMGKAIVTVATPPVVPQEGRVDLDDIRGNLQQGCRCGEAGAEVVDRNATPERTDYFHSLDSSADQGIRFGDLHHKPGCEFRLVADSAENIGESIRLREAGSRKIAAENQRLIGGESRQHHIENTQIKREPTILPFEEGHKCAGCVYSSVCLRYTRKALGIKLLSNIRGIVDPLGRKSQAAFGNRLQNQALMPFISMAEVSVHRVSLSAGNGLEAWLRSQSTMIDNSVADTEMSDFWRCKSASSIFQTPSNPNH